MLVQRTRSCASHKHDQAHLKSSILTAVKIEDFKSIASGAKRKEQLAHVPCKV